MQENPFGGDMVRLKGEEVEILKLTTLSQPLKAWRFDYGEDSVANAGIVTLAVEIDTSGTVNSLPSANTFIAATGRAK